MAYGRYKAMEAAVAVWQNKVSAGTWAVSQKVTQLDIAKIFFKRSNYYDLKKVIEPIKRNNNPGFVTMIRWLENGLGAPSESEAWGEIKRSGAYYSRGELEEWTKQVEGKAAKQGKKSHKKKSLK